MIQTDTIASDVDTFIAGVLRDVDAFLTETGRAPTMFCKAAVNDPNLLRHIRMGRRRLTFGMAVRLKKYMESQIGEMGDGR